MCGEDVLLLLGSRLSGEKRPGRALDALAALRHLGVRAALVVAGDGPLRARLESRARAERLPAGFLGHVADRAELARLQASADLCVAPGPAETFGLSALEALACGTPVVASGSSALPEVIGSAGLAAADTGRAFAGQRTADDRLHPAERGHRRLAAGFHQLLAERGLAIGAPPGLEPQQPPPTRAASVFWLATEGTGWLARRSTDLLPQLLGLATAEAVHRARGASGRLDARAERALLDALDDLPRTPFVRGFVPRARMEG